MGKAISAYLSIPTIPDTLDWIFGVVVTTSLYWLGLYELSSTHVLPALFHIDYSSSVLNVILIGSSFIFSIIHLVGLILSGAVIYASYWMITWEWYSMDFGTNPSNVVISFATKILMLSLFLFLGLGGLAFVMIINTHFPENCSRGLAFVPTSVKRVVYLLSLPFTLPKDDSPLLPPMWVSSRHWILLEYACKISAYFLYFSVILLAVLFLSSAFLLSLALIYEGMLLTWGLLFSFEHRSFDTVTS